MKEIFSLTWQLYRQHFGLICLIVLFCWVPAELFSSYMDYFVFDPDDYRISIKLSLLIENTVGVINTAAVISIVYAAYISEHANFGYGLTKGLRAWGRLFWARFLSGIVILFGLIAFIIPGFYLAVRLSLLDSAAVCEHISGSKAMRRSFGLSKGKFWRLFLINLIIFMPIVLCWGISLLIPDNWLTNTVLNLIIDFLAAFFTVCLFAAYKVLSEEQ